jgi:MYXO-CTERM domain-containing protein
MRTYCKALCGIACAILFLSFCPAAFADSVTVSVTPVTQNVALGSPVEVTLQIAGLGDLQAPSLGVLDLNVTFDPTVLSFASAVFGDPSLGDELDPTGSGNVINFILTSPDSVELFDLSLDSSSDLNSLQPSGFVLAQLIFNSTAPGTSSLDVSINTLGDADGNSLSADIQNGTAQVSAVPEPSSGTLAALGVLGMALCAAIRPRRHRPD